MARVQRGNVVLHVGEDEVNRYLQLGYNLTSSTGEVIKAAIPNDLATLQKMHLEDTAKIAELENTVATLTSQLADLRRAHESKEPKKTSTKKSTKE